MNYLHQFKVHFLFLHPSAFRYTQLFIVTRPSPQLHLTLSAFHPCSLLSTLSAPNIVFGRGMMILSGDGNVEGWKGGEKRKSCGEEKREGENSKQWITQRMWINTINVSFYLVSIFGHILHTPPFIPPSLHPRSSLTPPSHHPSITFTQPLQPYPSLPPTLPPTPFHLLHPLSASFSFVGGERGGQEAVEKRRGKA